MAEVDVPGHAESWYLAFLNVNFSKVDVMIVLSCLRIFLCDKRDFSSFSTFLTT